ncbi:MULTISPECIES: type II and III secretion system protein family protein [Comamonas]|uniref:Membrane protein n=1 Tax=Comamonas thiooxydans TaxID=363952 RepID=A0A454Y2Q7_9BURK|nr:MULTISPECIES: pilus assembly protein N-terminal domain-containing protein [Comamonas]ACY35232.1 type II and III secretion system protein [Comamonas thiooxydans]KGH01007.1 membrane protein [Comamonas thiooxydans]MBL5977114.1 pilus assembly protein N-terminal domain-containing protein [Comamonas sp. NyZ500]MDO1473334.1 type II and III secretion system protein family protein [Comamonas thiooxydans]
MNNKTVSIASRTFSLKPLYLLCGLSLSVVTAPVLAQQVPNTGESRAQQATAAREIKLVMGAQHELNLPGGVERIAIGDDTIAAVHIKRAGKGAAAKILLSPLKPGSTSFMVWPRGEAQAQTYMLNVQQRVELRTAKASSLIEQQFAGELANAQSADKAKTVDLSSVQLKSNVVQVDVKVVEFNKTQMKKVGLNLFSTAPNSSGFSFGIFGRGSYGISGGSSTTGAAANPLTQAFNLLMQFDKAGIGVNIGMLEGNNLARVLAAPTLVALSGQSANFLSGGEVPVPVPAGTGMVAIQYKPYGIGLTVSPTVLSNDRIVLKVAPEASELDYANTIVLNSATVPSITTRRADTTVELGDGESFVIGGLVSRNTTSGTDKVPLLGDIPILGVLFKRQEFQQKESELAIVVTPRLVKPLARDVNVEPLLPGRTEQRDPAVWGPWVAGGLSSSVAPGFSR